MRTFHVHLLWISHPSSSSSSSQIARVVLNCQIVSVLGAGEINIIYKEKEVGSEAMAFPGIFTLFRPQGCDHRH